MTTKTPTIPAPVHAGAGWLDTVNDGWDARIDVDNLIAWHPYFSVPGQVYGYDGNAPLTVEERIRYGFEPGCPGVTYEQAKQRMAAYETLTAGWRALIEARRS